MTLFIGGFYFKGLVFPKKNEAVELLKLGLHFINELVKFNKGAIEVISQLGKETIFRVLLPNT